MAPFFIIAFKATLIILGITLIILCIILTNRKLLQRKGYNEKYIAYLRKSNLIRLGAVAVLLPILILFSAWIVTKITGPLTEEVQLGYIVILLILLSVPFKYLDEVLNQKQIMKLALETNEKVAIDFKYKTLHLIFQPLWEIILGISCLVYGVFFLYIEQWIIYLFLIFPWMIYLTNRVTKYRTRSLLKDNYKYLFAFNLFSYLFFFSYFYSYLIIKLQHTISLISSGNSQETINESAATIFLLILGSILSVGLIGRISLYIANYRSFTREIDAEKAPFKTTRSRKLVFFGASLIFLLAFTGIGLMAGLFKQTRIDVGTVTKKYIIRVNQAIPDTLAVFDRNGLMYAGQDLNLESSAQFSLAELLDQYHGNNLKLGCHIELFQKSFIKNFQVCCDSTFEELPFACPVKFEYNSDNTITRLID